VSFVFVYSDQLIFMYAQLVCRPSYELGWMLIYLSQFARDIPVCAKISVIFMPYAQSNQPGNQAKLARKFQNGNFYLLRENKNILTFITTAKFWTASKNEVCCYSAVYRLLANNFRNVISPML